MIVVAFPHPLLEIDPVPDNTGTVIRLMIPLLKVDQVQDGTNTVIWLTVLDSLSTFQYTLVLDPSSETACSAQQRKRLLCRRRY